jgi:hypothetical protein
MSPFPMSVHIKHKHRKEVFGGRSLCIRYLTTGKEKTENPCYPKTKENQSHNPENQSKKHPSPIMQ